MRNSMLIVSVNLEPNIGFQAGICFAGAGLAAKDKVAGMMNCGKEDASAPENIKGSHASPAILAWCRIALHPELATARVNPCLRFLARCT